jgi:hypothetical protein
MKHIEYDTWLAWQQAFYYLNIKFGNDVWGASLEYDGKGRERIRMYVSTEKNIEDVMAETMGVVDNKPIVFTLMLQKDYKVL